MVTTNGSGALNSKYVRAICLTQPIGTSELEVDANAAVAAVTPLQSGVITINYDDTTVGNIGAATNTIRLSPIVNPQGAAQLLL